MNPATSGKIPTAHGAATAVSQSVVHHFHRLDELVGSPLRLLLMEHLVHARAEATCNAIPAQGLLILHTRVTLPILISNHVLQERIVACHCTLMPCRTRHAEAIPAAIPIVLQKVVNLIL